MRVDPFYVQQLAVALNNTTATEAQLSEELSSGLAVTTLSADPVAVSQSTVIGGAIAADDSYVSAAATEQSKLQVADSTLGEVVSALTNAISLTVSGGDGTLSTSARQTIGAQLTQIQQQVLSLANTTYLGQYIFSGSQGSTQPFVQTTEGIGGTPGVTTYKGDSSIQFTTTENGQKIQTSVPGSTIFDAAGTSVFKALNQVVADFNSTTLPEGAVQADSSALTAALGTVNTQRSFLDSSLAQVESTSTYAQTDAVQETAAQSSLLSANTADVATGLSSAETQATALDNVIATLEKGSLFDYLK